MNKLGPAVAAVLAAAASVSAATADVNSRLSRAARVVRQVRPLIPDRVWDGAHCVAVLPGLKKGTFTAGAGVMSCRSGVTWTAPLFLQLRGGFHPDAEEIDLVVLVMNEGGVQELLQDKAELGADARVEILSYSRRHGVFAGVDLSGGTLQPDENTNRDVYGRTATPRTILASRGLTAPQAAAFLAALRTASGTTAAGIASGAGEALPRATSTTGPGAPPSRAMPQADATVATVRTRILDMQQTLDRLLSSGAQAPLDASAGPTTSGGTVRVARAELQRLRQQLDAMLAALDRRR